MISGEVKQPLGVRRALESSGLDFGPISVHDKMRALGMEAPSIASLAWIFRETGVARVEPRKKPRTAYRRLVYPAPNACWQLDATGYVLAGGRKCVIFQRIDDHSRYAVASHAATGEASKDAVRVVKKAIRAQGVPQRLLSDNGAAEGSIEACLASSQTRPRLSTVIFAACGSMYAQAGADRERGTQLADHSGRGTGAQHVQVIGSSPRRSITAIMVCAFTGTFAAGSVTCSPRRPERPALSASESTGARPARDTRLDSSIANGGPAVGFYLRSVLPITRITGSATDIIPDQKDISLSPTPGTHISHGGFSLRRSRRLSSGARSRGVSAFT